MLVSQFIGSKGNGVKNHFIITDGNRTAFQSYKSVVCEIVENPGMRYDKLVRFGKDWNYSNTTTRHRNEFLKQMGLDILASTESVKEALKRGYVRLDESIAVLYDDTL